MAQLDAIADAAPAGGGEAAAFESCVFINCPLDKDYEPILQAILFCVVYLGFSPRLSTERSDSGEN